MSHLESIRGIAAAVRAGEVTAEEITLDRLGRVERARALGAVLHADREGALAAARRIDRRRREGGRLGELAGVPVGIKDTICTLGIPTTCGSRMLEGWIPPYEATAVRKLREADAIPLAKTSCDEFGMGSSTETCAFGPARHPRDPGRVPGGSSGGSAAVVASAQLPAALGTDTGGSVRQPAALCGIVGLKPTYGRISRYGLVAFASSFDQIGPMTRDVGDAALLSRVLAGPDPRDATTRDDAWPEPTEPLFGSGRSPRIGWIEDYLEMPDLHPRAGRAVEEAAHILSHHGASLEPVRLPEARRAVPIYYVLACAEASSNLARFDGARFGLRVDPGGSVQDMYHATRGRGFGTEVKRRVLLGTFALSAGYREAFYQRAMTARQQLTERLNRAWQRCSVLIAPSVLQPAFALGEKLDDPVAMYASDLCTVLANVAGVPAISLPAPDPVELPAAGGRFQGAGTVSLPLGLQLLAPPGGEARLIEVARRLESDGFRGGF